MLPMRPPRRAQRGEIVLLGRGEAGAGERKQDESTVARFAPASHADGTSIRPDL